MSEALFDPSPSASTQDSLDFITNILQSSTEYSIIGKGTNGTILLWNEGARRLYGYEAGEVVGKANADILHGWALATLGKGIISRNIFRGLLDQSFKANPGLEFANAFSVERRSVWKETKS